MPKGRQGGQGHHEHPRLEADQSEDVRVQGER